MSSVDKIVFSQLLGPGGKLQDVNFVIMDKSGEIQGELKAHKLILSLVSEVFERQFYGPLAESNKQAGIFLSRKFTIPPRQGSGSIMFRFASVTF
jgi:hypothetical protein